MVKQKVVQQIPPPPPPFCCCCWLRDPSSGVTYYNFFKVLKIKSVFLMERRCCRSWFGIRCLFDSGIRNRLFRIPDPKPILLRLRSEMIWMFGSGINSSGSTTLAHTLLRFPQFCYADPHWYRSWLGRNPYLGRANVKKVNNAKNALKKQLKGTQAWEIFWLRFWILYFFIVI